MVGWVGIDSKDRETLIDWVCRAWWSTDDIARDCSQEGT